MLALLKGRQARFVDKLSELVLKDESDWEDFDSVHSLSDDGQTRFWPSVTPKMQRSQHTMDKKLLHFFTNFSYKKMLVQEEEH